VSQKERGAVQHGGTEFGALLKSLREKRGVSQSKLAERAEFDHSYVSRLESGARMPTREAVDRLGEAMSLEQATLDSLLAAAGFLPRDVSSLLSSEPVIGEVLDLLQDEAVPSEYRDNMRQVLQLLAQQARFAIKGVSARAQAA
jgi:transcriptional regulator with XRE-family HTH domain